MTSQNISIRFDAYDGKVDIATAISVLSDIMSILDSSVNRTGLWEDIDSLAHSSVPPSRNQPKLEARLNSVNDGSVEMIVDLSTTGLADPQTWFDTVATFFSLVSPYLPETGHEAVMGAIKGIAEVSTIGIGNAIIKRMRRFKDEKAENQATREEEDGKKASDEASQKKHLEDSCKPGHEQQTSIDNELLNEFFLDSDMLNAVTHLVKTLGDDQHGLNFMITTDSETSFSYLPFIDGAKPAIQQDEPSTVAFSDLPAVITWKPEATATEEREAAETRKVTVLYEGGKKKAVIDDMAFADVDFDSKDLTPGMQLIVKVSGKSIFTPSKGTYHTKDLTINEIIRRIN